jgi:hypothetical protein
MGHGLPEERTGEGGRGPDATVCESDPRVPPLGAGALEAAGRD